MKKKVLGALLLMVSIFFFTVTIAPAVEVDIGPADITLKSLKAKKPAQFPHRQHQQGIACMKCHHTEGQSMEIEKCRECHTEDMDNDKLNSQKKVSHALCTGCHKGLNKEKGEVVAPVKCSGCHPLKIKK